MTRLGQAGVTAWGALRRLAAAQAEMGELLARPVDRELLGDGAGAGVVEERLAYTGADELLQEGVEALAAEAEGLRIGAVAERDDAVLDTAEVGPARLEAGEERLAVVGD